MLNVLAVQDSKNNNLLAILEIAFVFLYLFILESRFPINRLFCYSFTFPFYLFSKLIKHKI